MKTKIEISSETPGAYGLEHSGPNTIQVTSHKYCCEF